MKNQKIFSYCSSIHKCRYGKAFHNGTIHMKWDNGRTLSLCPEADEFRRLTQEEIDEELRQQAQEQEQTPSPQEQSM